jgi:hypothetical protein
MSQHIIDQTRDSAKSVFARFAGQEGSVISRLKGKILSDERYEMPLPTGMFLKKFAPGERKLALAAVICEENVMKTLLNIINESNDEANVLRAAASMGEAAKSFGAPSITDLIKKGDNKSLESFVLRQKLEIETSLDVISQIQAFCSEFLPHTSELSISETAPGNGAVSLVDNANKTVYQVGTFNITEGFFPVSGALEIPDSVISTRYSVKEKGYVLSLLELNLAFGHQLVKESDGSLLLHLARIFTQSGYSFERLHTDIQTNLAEYGISQEPAWSFLTLAFKSINGKGTFVCELSQSFGSPELGKSLKLDVAYFGPGKPLKIAITDLDGTTHTGFEGSYVIV